MEDEEAYGLQYHKMYWHNGETKEQELKRHEGETEEQELKRLELHRLYLNGVGHTCFTTTYVKPRTIEWCGCYPCIYQHRSPIAQKHTAWLEFYNRQYDKNKNKK